VEPSPRVPVLLPNLKENKTQTDLSSASNKLKKLGSFNKI